MQRIFLPHILHPSWISCGIYQKNTPTCGKFINLNKLAIDFEVLHKSKFIHYITLHYITLHYITSHYITYLYYKCIYSIFEHLHQITSSPTHLQGNWPWEECIQQLSKGLFVIHGLFSCQSCKFKGSNYALGPASTPNTRVDHKAWSFDAIVKWKESMEGTNTKKSKAYRLTVAKHPTAVWTFIQIHQHWDGEEKTCC